MVGTPSWWTGRRCACGRPSSSRIEYDGELLAEISRRRLTVRDAYAVDAVREDADPPLLIAIAVCVIRMAKRERGDD